MFNAVSSEHIEQTRRAICIISSNPRIHELCQSIDELRTAAEERVMFLKKQAETEMKKAQKAKDPLWDEIKFMLKEAGALKDFNENTHHLTFNLKKDSIEMRSSQECHCIKCLLSNVISNN